MKIPIISKLLEKRAGVRLKSREESERLVRSLKSEESKNAEFAKEISEALVKARPPAEETPFDKVKRYQTEIASYQDLTPEKKQEKLADIEADSEWKAFYDLQAYPPREPYGENEEMFQSVPYFKATLLLRAEMSVGMGIKDVGDNHSQESTAQETYIQRVFDHLNIEQLLPKTQLHRDLYGNAYWHIEWTGDPNNPIEKIKIVQPPRMRIRLSKEVGNDVIGYAYIPPNLVYGMVPQPVPLDLQDCIHFIGDNIDDTPYGYSKVFGIKRLLQSRKEVNILEPIIYKHYTKPWIHWKLDNTGLSDRQTASYMDDMINSMIQAGPESDMITTAKWEASVVSGSSAKDPNLVKHLIEDNDSQMFATLKIPETYFKPKGTTDRMILKQDDNFRREMIRIQNYFNIMLKERLIKPLLEMKFGKQVVKSTDENGVPEYNYEIPEIIWNEVALENMFDMQENIRKNVASGLLTINEARKRIGEDEITVDQKTEMLAKGENPSTPQPTDNPLGAFNSQSIPTDPMNNPRFEQSAKKRHIVEDGDVRLVIEEM